MTKQDFREKKVKGEIIFAGRMINMERDTVLLPNGQETTREVVRHPGAVAVVAIRGEELLLVRQYRYPIDTDLLEIPAGKLDPDEEPIHCAERELREETGYRGTILLLGTFFTTPGFTNETMHIFLAQDLEWDPLTLDEDEFLEVETIPWKEALAKARNSEFRDAKTILGILLAAGRMS